MAYALHILLVIMKIAIPHWQGRISPVFDESRDVILVDIKNGREIGRSELKLRHSDPFLRAGDIADIGAEVLICGAISRTLEKALISKNVKIIAYTCGSIKDVIDAFINNKLSDPVFLMPGCRRKKYHETLKGLSK